MIPYLSEFLPNLQDPSKNVAQYHFVIGTDDEAFLLMGRFDAETDDFVVGPSFKLQREYTDKSKGQLIYKIISATSYYIGREGEYLTIYARNIASDGTKADFAIATKNGTHSILKNKGPIIGTTVEEAKAITPPEDDKIWQKNMMEYAHLWMSTTRK